MFAAGMSLNHFSAVPDKTYLIAATCSVALTNILLWIPNDCLNLAKNSSMSRAYRPLSNYLVAGRLNRLPLQQQEE